MGKNSPGAKAQNSPLDHRLAFVHSLNTYPVHEIQALDVVGPSREVQKPLAFPGNLAHSSISPHVRAPLTAS